MEENCERKKGTNFTDELFPLFEELLSECAAPMAGGGRISTQTQISSHTGADCEENL